MVQARERAGLPPVTDETRETRGEALRQRMLALGLDVSKVARSTGRTRNTITRAMAGESSTLTLDQLEVWFDREERKVGLGGGPQLVSQQEERARKPVTIRMEEGGTFVVEGPVDTDEDAEVLTRIARDLMREWKSKPPDPSE